MSPDVVWLGWLVLFLVYELTAAITKNGGTLSEFVGRVIGVRRWSRIPKPYALARRAVLFAFLQSLTMHLVFGWTVIPVIALGAFVALLVVWSSAREKDDSIPGRREGRWPMDPGERAALERAYREHAEKGGK